MLRLLSSLLVLSTSLSNKVELSALYCIVAFLINALSETLYINWHLTLFYRSGVGLILRDIIIIIIIILLTVINQPL